MVKIDAYRLKNNYSIITTIMEKYDLGLTIMTPGNNANHTARVHYLGVVGEERIDKVFAEFSGGTQKEVIAKAMQSIYGELSECGALSMNLKN